MTALLRVGTICTHTHYKHVHTHAHTNMHTHVYLSHPSHQLPSPPSSTTSLPSLLHHLSSLPPHHLPERALAFKEEGNALFRRGEYRAAVKAYSEGLGAKAQDTMMNAVLYTNRANAQHHLGELRTTLPLTCMCSLKSASLVCCRQLSIGPTGLRTGTQVQPGSCEGHL